MNVIPFTRNNAAQITSVKRSVLLIDADPAYLRQMLAVLESLNFNVLTARTNGAGWVLFTLNRPDITIISLDMKDEKELITINNMRYMNLDCLIIVTGNEPFPDMRLSQAAVSLGADCYIQKPLTPTRLCHHIMMHMGNRKPSPRLPSTRNGI